MSDDALPGDVPESLDRARLGVRDAFRSRDLAAYGWYFAPDLEYVMASGRKLSHDQFLRSVRRQFDRLLAFDSTFERASLELSDGTAIEAGTQRASITLRVLGLFAVTWAVERAGRFSWRRTAVGWELFAIELTREQVRRESFRWAHSRS